MSRRRIDLTGQAIERVVKISKPPSGFALLSHELILLTAQGAQFGLKLAFSRARLHQPRRPRAVAGAV